MLQILIWLLCAALALLGWMTFVIVLSRDYTTPEVREKAFTSSMVFLVVCFSVAGVFAYLAYQQGHEFQSVLGFASSPVSSYSTGGVGGLTEMDTAVLGGTADNMEAAADNLDAAMHRDAQ